MTTPFDRLANRFSRNIYDTPKGQLRLALLKEDLLYLASGPQLSVLDAGGGLGQMSRWFATHGHAVVHCDVAEAMLTQARELNVQEGLVDQIELVHAPLERFCVEDSRRFDLVLCHAVLEWLADPKPLLTMLTQKLNPGGRISLMFYNRHALVLKNVLKGNFRQVKRDDWRGDGGGLTPDNPQDPEAICRWFEEAGLSVEMEAGMRCFYDYLPLKVRQTYAFEDILEMERLHRHQLPYRQMARYIHIVGRMPK